MFSELTGVSPSRFDVRLGGGEAETVEGGYVIGNFFSALGVDPAIGRLIEPRDDELGSGNAAVAVLSWSY